MKQIDPEDPKMLSVTGHVSVGPVGQPTAFVVQMSDERLCDDDHVRRFRLNYFALTTSGAKDLFRHLGYCVPYVDAESDTSEIVEKLNKIVTTTSLTNGSWIYVAKKKEYEWTDIHIDISSAITDFLGVIYRKVVHVVGVYKIKDSESVVRVIETNTRYSVCDSSVYPCRDVAGIVLVLKNDSSITYATQRHELDEGTLYAGESMLFMIRRDQGSITFKDTLRDINYDLQKI